MSAHANSAKHDVILNNETQILKVIWSFGIRGQKSFERIPICLISIWKHIMYAYLHENYAPEMCLVLVEFEVKTWS